MSLTTNKTVILKALQDNNKKSLSGGILKIDLISQIATLSMPSFNIATDEKAYLIIASELNSYFHFKLESSKRQELKLSKDILNASECSYLVVVCESEMVTPLLFADASKQNHKLKDLIEYAKSIENENKTNHAPESQAITQPQKREENVQCLIDYDDDAIADVNYYENDQKGEKENATVCEQDVSSFNANFKNDAQEENECPSSRYETSPCNAEQQKEPEYYRSIKEKINSLFSKYPPIDALTAIIPHSKWVKIPFSAPKHYAIGTIKELGVIRYLVYGVPGFYSTKPKGFERNSCFIPLSPFNLLGEGYWCVFQEADSGKQIYCDGN